MPLIISLLKCICWFKAFCLNQNGFVSYILYFALQWTCVCSVSKAENWHLIAIVLDFLVFCVCALIATVSYCDCRKLMGLYGGCSQISYLKKRMLECVFDGVFDFSAYCANECWLAFNGVSCFWGICLVTRVVRIQDVRL